MALGGYIGLKPVLGCVWVGAQTDEVVWSTPSAQQDSTADGTG